MDEEHLLSHCLLSQKRNPMRRYPRPIEDEDDCVDKTEWTCSCCFSRRTRMTFTVLGHPGRFCIKRSDTGIFNHLTSSSCIDT